MAVYATLNIPGPVSFDHTVAGTFLLSKNGARNYNYDGFYESGYTLAIWYKPFGQYGWDADTSALTVGITEHYDNGGSIGWVIFRDWIAGSQQTSFTDYGVDEELQTVAITGYPEAPVKAIEPSPENEETGIDWEDLTLCWSDGGDADEHIASLFNVYFSKVGESLSLVGTIDLTYGSLELEVTPPDLDYNATYQWRIDSVNSAGTAVGDTWTFTTIVGPPLKATTPSPADSATGVVFSQTNLSWVDPGAGTSSASAIFQVYFDDEWVADVTEPTIAIPTLLLPGVVHTWYVDSENDCDIEYGDTWTFTVSDYPITNVQNNGVWHPNGTYTAIIYAPDSNVGVTLCYDDAESNFNKVLGTGISVESKLSSLWSRYAIEVPGNVGTGTLYIKWHYDA